MRYLIKMMMFLFCFKWGRRIVLTSLAMMLIFVFFSNFGPQTFKMSPFQIRVGNALIEKAVERFPWSANVGSVMMIAEEDAWSPFFQDKIRERVTKFKSDGSRKFDILPDGFSNRVIKSLGFKNDVGILSKAKIKRIKDTMTSDTLLLVRFTKSDYQEDENISKGQLVCVFHRKGDDNPIEIKVEVAQEKNISCVDRVILYFQSMSTMHRFVWGVLGVLLFPFLTAPITLSITKYRSAKANGLMIFIYSIVIFLAEGVLLPAPSDIFDAILVCVWGIIIVWYLLKTSDLLASPEFTQRMKVF